jgi:hypothetical protein
VVYDRDLGALAEVLGAVGTALSRRHGHRTQREVW